LRIALASTSVLGVPTLSKLIEQGHVVTSLISKPAKKSGRGLVEHQTEIEIAAEQAGISKFVPHSPNELKQHLIETKPDIAIAISYGEIIREEALQIPKHGWLNLHFSLLPKYRGAAPVQRAILAGETVSGFTIFRLDQGLDTGPIFSQHKVEINNGNAGEILEIMAKLGASKIPEIIKKIEAGDQPTAQVGEPSIAKKIGKSETKIDWLKSAASIVQQVRALSPKPGAWTTLNEKRLKLEQIQIAPGQGAPGSIIKRDPLLVATGDGAIAIEALRPESGKSLSAQDWLRGARIDENSRFL
jgi:methionyl-tRNA formyltransferase